MIVYCVAALIKKQLVKRAGHEIELELLLYGRADDSFLNVKQNL
jgi:hypothetical protein